MAGFFEKRRQERAEREAMMEAEENAEKAAQEERERAQEVRRRALSNIIITPESKKEYANSVGSAVERIVLPHFDRGVIADVDRRFGRPSINSITDEEVLLSQGICAIVNATYMTLKTPYSVSELYYGIPVRRKR
jgi:septal ring factor EnvC (AmiA/AmiB activator)